MARKHKKHLFHLSRVGLLGVMLLALFIVRFDAGASSPSQSTLGQVLAYASEMSHGGLLSGTNAARAANGLGALSSNAQLNNSAQAKAQHMATHDYWAHNAPDGTQPWYFFSQAGYDYTRAGENLAYGFSSSQATIDGWMNSAGHRANILGDFNDVGFGIVNAPNYQASGPQTIVVAHYGKPVAPPPPPAAPVAPTPPASLPAATPTPATPTTPETPAVPEPGQETPVAKPETPAAASNEPVSQPVQTAEPARVTVLGLLASSRVPMVALLGLSIVSVAVLGYALTHRLAFHRAVQAGEHFVVAHPGVDTIAVGVVTSLILLTTYGHVG